VSAEKDVLVVAAELVSAFGHHDTDKYFSFFAPDATFIFYNHPHTLTSREDYRAVWGRWESEEGFQVLSCESSHQAVSLVTKDCAVFTHHVNTRASLGGEIIESWERETIVFSNRDGRWVAVHEHLSAREQEES
jgi:ketosteroid isomerase-like protein